MRLLGLAFAILAAVVVWGACGGGGSPLSKIVVEPGRISCDAFGLFKSYRYRTEVVYDLEPRDPSMEPTDPYKPDPFNFTQVMEGAAQEGDRMEATSTVSSDGNEQPALPVIVIGDMAWFSLAGSWEPKPVSEVGAFPIAYLPRDLCDAIAPDINVSEMTGEPETVGGIPSQKYHFDSLRSDFPDRHPNFTPQSDIAQYVNEYQGDIWIADEGSYISKLDLTGTGAYENGRKLSLRMFLELSDIDDESIQIEPPS